MKKQGADVIGAKAGAKPKKPYIQKDTIGSTQNAEIVYGIGDGENGGLINGLNSIILDGTRVIGSSGEFNFNEVKYEERFGLIDQPHLKLIEDTITERGLNLEVRSAAPVVSSFNNKDVDKFVVRISVPSLMQNKDNGDSVAASISYAIDISVDGGAYQTVVEASATEKITNGYEFDHEIEAPEGTQRTIRVRRTMPDSTSQLLIDKFYVAAISEVINAKFSHPTLHYIGLVFNAEQFNNIPKAVFHYYGRKIKVPVNYNPTTRQYDGIWNGTFKVVYSNNPAWVLFDILTDRRSGLGRRIPVELVDKWELYRIAQYCDELVPDGEGGMEPRFVCNNLVLNSKQDAYQVLKDIASIFRGQSFWNGSQVVTVADAPRDIDYAISMASVISYSYSGTARNARHNVVKVQYYDKNNENSAAYEYATDYDSIRETEQINEVEIRAFGCTSAGQAQRLARYTLLSEQTETRILTAKLSMDAFVNMQIGDVFAWSDKFLAGANNGGRVVAVNGAELTLDRDVTDSALVGDTLFVNTTSGKANTRTITAINGNKVTLDAVMSTTEPEFVWVIDSAELSLLYFKLDDYKVNPAEGTVDIVGIQHVNGKFGTIDTETALEAPPFSKVEIETLRAPGNVTTNYNVRVDQGLNISDLYVSWGQVKGATRYTVEFRRDSQAWRVLGNVTGLTHTIENVSAGIYEVRVRAADSIGNMSPYEFSAPINVAGIVLPPPKLASFSAVGKLLAIETKWAFPAGTEASLAVVIEHATQDPANVGVPTQKLNIPYPQTEYVFNGLGAHTQMWFRAAIVDKYNQEGEFTAWTTATADANPEELIGLISGHISESTLDQILKGKIDGAGALAGEANSLASQANAAASNAQNAATQASTKAQEAANAVVQEAINRAAAIQDGITQVTTDYRAGDAVVLGELVAYKTSNDSAMATVVQKAESAVAVGSTNSQAITELTGQVQAINNTKLDASVISNYYTKGQADDNSAEIAAGKIESYNANLMIGGANLLTETKTFNKAGTVEASKTTLRPNYVGFGSAFITDAASMLWRTHTLIQVRKDWCGFYYSCNSDNPADWFADQDMTLSVWVLNNSNADVTAYGIVPAIGHVATISGGGWQRIVLHIEKGRALRNSSNQGIIEFNFTSTEGAFYYAAPMLQYGNAVTAWQPSAEEVQNALDANASVIQSTAADVSRIDGVVTSQASQIVTLESSKSAIENGGIAGNDEYIVDLRDPAYNRDLYYPVLLSNFSTELRQTIRVSATLDGVSVPSWSYHGGGFSLNAQFQMGGAGWGTIDPEIVTDNFSFAFARWDVPPLDQIGQITESSQPFFYVRGGGYYRLSKPVNRSVQVCAPDGSLSGYFEGTLYPRPYQASTVPKSINQGLNQQNVKLQQTNTVLDGVKAVSTVTVDNNGVMSGYGLISELANGQVRSSFGVNADTFYIGSPSLDKKPFVQKNEWTLINGVLVPPGTYIDTAFIANATIGLAHINTASIGSLSALSATIGLFRTAPSGRRTEISDAGLRVYNDAGIAVIEIGDF